MVHWKPRYKLHPRRLIPWNKIEMHPKHKSTTPTCVGSLLIKSLISKHVLNLVPLIWFQTILQLQPYNWCLYVQYLKLPTAWISSSLKVWWSNSYWICSYLLVWLIQFLIYDLLAIWKIHAYVYLIYFRNCGYTMLLF